MEKYFMEIFIGLIVIALIIITLATSIISALDSIDKKTECNHPFANIHKVGTKVFCNKCKTKIANWK